jgi:nucleoside-diphosphate-sugar epimerase
MSAFPLGFSGKPRILVTGASGAVGPRVVEAFHAAGCPVRTLSLDLPSNGLFPSGIETQVGEITDSEVVSAAVRGIDAVVHMAALLHVMDPEPSLKKEYERINVGGTETVVHASIAAGVKRVVLFSTIAVYSYNTGQILNEDTKLAPDTFYAQTKRAAEQIVLAAHLPDGGPLGTVLRLSAVYGARVKGNYRRLLESLARGWFVTIGSGANRRTLVYDRDVAAATVLAALHPSAAGRIYNVSDGLFHTMNEIIQTLSAALGRPSPRTSLPAGPMRLAAGILEDVVTGLGKKPPVSRSTIDKYTEDVAVSSQRIQAELGFVPQFDLAKGWQETVQEMRQAGDLVKVDA